MIVRGPEVRKCYDCKHYRECLFCGYVSSHCEVFGSLDMDQKERHPDITGATCPKWSAKKQKAGGK